MVAHRYYNSDWRRDTAGCPGGMIMESSVHFTAALRMLAAAGGLGEATEVTARTTHTKADLSDPDSIVGVVRFEHGAAPASMSISLAASQVRGASPSTAHSLNPWFEMQHSP